MDFANAVTTPFGTFGAPPDGVAWAALGVGLASLWFGWRTRPRDATWPPRPTWLAAAALALTLSAGYVTYYLRGGPRIIDATSYLLQSRIFAAGGAVFTPPEPLASFAGRFLVQDAAGTGLAVLFPPGYAAALAPFSWLGVPMALGPILAALLVAATYALGTRLFDAHTGSVAALLSAVCATLRYHTADTMSHGLAALALCLVLYGAHTRTLRGALIAGTFAGWLLCTRPITGVVGVAIAAGLVRDRRTACVSVLALLPPIVLLLIYQRAVTGSLLGSPQLEYYAHADGPPGCFTYGFGNGIGCVVEHGDFVRDNLPDGYGLAAAMGTTLRRLKHHLLDAGNVELFFLLLLAAFYLGRRERNIRLLMLACVGVVAGYAPFYFDGNYPGGGARLYADVLPLEHIAIAWWLVRRRAVWFGLGAALIGFALHGVFEHRLLADREGGRPMFEERVLGATARSRSLIFIGTDHGFNLGYRPDGRPTVARYRGDAHDWLLWTQLGRPPAFRYRFELGNDEPRSRLEPYEPAESLRYEFESLWPPEAIRGGWVRPDFAPCFSRDRALALVPVQTLEASFRLFVGESARYQVSLNGRGSGPPLRVRLGGRTWTARPPTAACGTLANGVVFLGRGAHRLTLSASSGWSLDSLNLVRLDPPAGKR